MEDNVRTAEVIETGLHRLEEVAGTGYVHNSWAKRRYHMFERRVGVLRVWV